MADVTLEEVVKQVKSLTPDQLRQLREALGKEARTGELRRIQGKYAHLTTNSESFAARKPEEIELEDRPRQTGTE